MKSKSLHQANIVFLFADTYSFIPENVEFNSLFGGKEAVGINFMDDPAIRTKIVDAPRAGLQVVWEGTRLRIEDKNAIEPKESKLVSEAIRIYHALVPKNAPLRGLGFNFDVIFQFDDVIRMQDMFSMLAPGALLLDEGLMDFGWQWTVMSKDSKQLTRYFIKIAAPLELMMHVNYHYSVDHLLDEKEIMMRHKVGYEELGGIVDRFNLH
ncbi:MAG: hypothetical protein WCW78_02050 [Candidatus Paceibacterota bacterium]|jgi:hypothetical protein